MRSLPRGDGGGGDVEPLRPDQEQTERPRPDARHPPSRARKRGFPESLFRVRRAGDAGDQHRLVTGRFAHHACGRPALRRPSDPAATQPLVRAGIVQLIRGAAGFWEDAATGAMGAGIFARRRSAIDSGTVG